MKKHLKKFASDRRGIAAIEFAILGPAFVALCVAIMEICLFTFSSSAMQRSVEDAVFKIRTGSVFADLVDAGVSPEQWLKQEVCSGLTLPTCSNTIRVAVQKFDTNFNVYTDSNDTGIIDVGAPSIVMRVEVEVDMFNLMFTRGIYGDEAMTLAAGLTFMTEPY